MANESAQQVRVVIRSDSDIVIARRQGRALAEEASFARMEQTLIATAISELARNIVKYAGEGEIVLTMVTGAGRIGLSIVARDKGPGIPDIEAAMKDGFSTGNSLGLGLPVTQRLMDEFAILSESGKGTEVTMIKWG